MISLQSREILFWDIAILFPNIRNILYRLWKQKKPIFKTLIFYPSIEQSFLDVQTILNVFQKNSAAASYTLTKIYPSRKYIDSCDIR